ncbi:hypothetical protein ACQ7B2_01735, partial [Escherichia coli]
LRIWRSHDEPKQIFIRLVDERAKTISTAIRLAGLATVGTLWLLANKSELALRVSVVDLSIPASYVNFAVSCMLTGAVLNIISYFVLN